MNTQTNQTRKASSTDSLFGMALAQAFTGLAFGAEAGAAWEAAETASAIHKDRTEAKAQKQAQNGAFELGAKHSLSGIFKGMQQSLGEIEHALFTPSFALTPGRPSPSFA